MLLLSELCFFARSVLAGVVVCLPSGGGGGPISGHGASMFIIFALVSNFVFFCPPPPHRILSCYSANFYTLPLSLLVMCILLLSVYCEVGGGGGGGGGWGQGPILADYIWDYLNLELLLSCPPLHIFHTLNLELLLSCFPSTPILKDYFRI